MKIFSIKNVIFLLIIGIILMPNFCLSADVSAEIDNLNKEISARKDKIKELEDTISNYKQSIKQKQTEAMSLKNQMSIINDNLKQLQADIDLTKEKIKKAQLEIESLNISIAEKEKTISRQKLIITKIIQGLHANDQKNFIEIMLTNESFADFYNQATYLENIYTDLGRSVKKYRLAKEELDAQKKVVEARKKAAEDLKAQLDNQNQDLRDRLVGKQNILTQTQSSEQKYQTLLSSLKKQYNIIENEVQSYEDQVRKKLAEQDRFKNLSSGGSFGWPVSGRYITATFHDPDYPFRRVFEHSGVDIRAPQGSPVRASASGYIGRAKRCSLSSCYSYILLIHNGNISTLYGHLSNISVSEDSFVNKGDLIGYSGGTPGTVGAGPFVTGPHLHFEVRQNGIPVNPMGYLP